MENLIGLGIALLVAAVAARAIIHDARPPDPHPFGPLERGGAPPAQLPPSSDQTRQPTVPSAEDFIPEPAPDLGNGLVITAFKPLVPRAVPQSLRRPPAAVSVSGDMLPGARIEIVDLAQRRALGDPALRPDPNRLIQTEVALPAGPVARFLALLKLVVGVTSFGILFGFGIVLSVRLIAFLFTTIF